MTFEEVGDGCKDELFEYKVPMITYQSPAPKKLQRWQATKIANVARLHTQKRKDIQKANNGSMIKLALNIGRCLGSLNRQRHCIQTLASKPGKSQNSLLASGFNIMHDQIFERNLL
jgi:hypothetical protein